MDTRTKVLCIGVDAGEKELILRGAQAGWLPTFRSLLARSAWGVIKNPTGPLTGAVWGSLNTGVTPAQHGRYWYRQLRSGTYSVHLNPFSALKSPPFWDTLSRAGRRVAIIDAPETSPVRDLNGIQLVNWTTHANDGTGFQTWPRSLAGDVTARFGHDPVGNCDERARRGVGELPALSSDVLARIGQKEALSDHFLNQGGWDLFLTVFGEAHCAGHQFWHLHDATHPAHSAELAVTFGDPVEDAYRAIDAALGRLLERATPDTAVLVICSHGMGPCYGGNFLLDEVLRRIENVAPPPQRWRVRDPFLWGWQRTPAALRTRLAPLRAHAVHRIKQVPTTLDGTRRCFQVPSNDGCGGIRINLAGREPRGQVHPGAEYDAFCAALTLDLMALVNVDTGGPVVRQVWRAADLYQGPSLAELPDLLVEWNREAPIVRVRSPKTGEVDGINPQIRTGDHTLDGVLFALAPSLRPGQIDPISSIDVAPTIAALLGVALPMVEGKPLAALRATSE